MSGERPVDYPPPEQPERPTAEQLDHLVQTDPAAALRAARRLLAGADGSAVDEAVALAAMGRALFEMGEVERAVTAFRHALAAVERDADADLAFSVVMSASAVLAEAGEIGEALAEIDRIAPGNTPAQRGRLLTQRSYVLHHAGRLAEALKQLDLAEPEFTGSGDELGWLRLLVNRGLIRVQQGHFELAERDLLEAERVASSLGQVAMRAGIASNLGVVYGRSRRIRDALEQFHKASQLHDAAGRPGRMFAVTQLDRAETLMFAGLVGEALESAEAAIAHVAPTGNRVVLGDSQLLVARMHLATGRFDTARRAADSAASSFEHARRPAMATLARSVAANATLMEVEDAGHPALAEAAALVGELERAGWQRVADELRVSRVRCARRTRAMEPVAGDVAHLRLGAFSGQRDLALAGWYAEAIGRATDGAAGAALDACRSGLDLLDDIVAEAPTLAARSAAMRLGNDLSQTAIELAVALGEGDTVLAAAEGTRARALHDELGEQRRHRPLTVDGALRLQVELSGRLAERVLVEWVIAGAEVWAVVLEHGQTRLVRLGGVNEVLRARDRLLVWLDRATEEPDAPSVSAVRAAGALDELLLAPLALPAEVGLVLVPVGGLHAIPWSGLPSLAARAVTLCPSAQVWLEADRRAARAARTVGVIVGPGVANPHLEREAIDLAYGSATVAAGAGATAATVRSMFAGLDLVHVAAHGAFRSDHPLLSTLRLDDGESTLYDTLPERVHSRLVVLSSCEAGAHAFGDGSEVLGLAAVMLARGAAGVLAPLTAVRELECAEFVVDVHAELAGGRPLAAAVAGVRRRWLADDDLSRWAVASSFSCFGSGEVAFVAGADRQRP